MVLFGLSTGTKGKFRILQKKNLIFSPLVSVNSPQEIEETNRNKFFRVFLPVQIPYFWTKNFFWLHLVPGTTSYTTSKLIFSVKLLFFLFIHREYILN
jgi:hypothetical protein